MTDCELCGGVGLVRTEKGSRPCDCQQVSKLVAALKRAHIPAGFYHATFDTFQRTETNGRALFMARRFAEEYSPVKAQGGPTGLLLTGSVGVGKTHLAVATMRLLIESRGIEGRFVDIRELLDRLRSSYDDSARETQAQILKPILEADLVVVDELGAVRPSDWVFETQELLIGGLYNRRGAVIVTTNLPNLPAGASEAANEYARAARPETLGDRIGTRMFSRLQEMCMSIDMTGKDWRQRK